MADCIQAQITANIKAALKLITIANGYSYDVAMVMEERKDIVSAINNQWPFILIIEDEPTFEAPENLTFIRFLNYRIWFFSAQNDDATGNPVTDLNTEIAYYNRNAIADITKALHVDATRGNNAEYTDIIPGSHAMHLDLGLFGTYCDLRITTDIDATNPYQNR